MQFFRFFHSIGQGAFYSERYIVDGKEFNIIYDCGSTTLKGKKLDTKIKSIFNKDQVIDLLFISHFHADHINGIETLKNVCKIKTVVLPLLDDESKVLIKIRNFLEDNYLETQLIDNPSTFFGEQTNIITVSEESPDEGADGVNLNEAALLDVSNISSSKTVSSGQVFISRIKNNDWYFIPFNYKQTLRKDQFVKALQFEGLELDDIDTLEKITIHKRKIKNSYLDIDGDLNENSLVLFSGNQNKEIFYTKFYQGWSYINNHFDYHSTWKNGCIYLGDVNLKAPNLILDLKKRLLKFIQFIGTIQIPHHGSIHNFDNSIIKEFECQCAIFSYGTSNTYGHPSDSVIAEVLLYGSQPFLITESQNTTVIQFAKSRSPHNT